MTLRKKIKPCKNIALIILIPLVIILLNAKFLVFNFSYYEKEFNKHNIYDNFDISKEEVNKEAYNIINYLKGKEELSDFLTEKEKLHLKDVKNLIRDYKYLTLLGLILTIILVLRTKNKKLLIKGCILTIILLTLFLILISTNFSSVFYSFHKVSFSNDLWLLEPDDNLIKLFPQEFFYEFAFSVIKNSILTALVIIILIYLHQKVNKN